MPKEYVNLLFLLKHYGINIELEKEFLNNLILEDILVKSDKGLIEHRKALIKLIYPDHVDESETIMEEAARRLKNSDPIMRVQVDKSAKIDTAKANRILNKESM